MFLHNYDRLSRIFSFILLVRNHMIFLVQYGINKHLRLFVVFEKITYSLLAYSFQIALEIMLLPILKKKKIFGQETIPQRAINHNSRHVDYGKWQVY